MHVKFFENSPFQLNNIHVRFPKVLYYFYTSILYISAVILIIRFFESSYKIISQIILPKNVSNKTRFVSSTRVSSNFFFF